jgi:hypothetical protein
MIKRGTVVAAVLQKNDSEMRELEMTASKVRFKNLDDIA